MNTKIIHPYIAEDKKIGNGKPIIKGTRTRIANIIAYYKLGYTAEELAKEFPHLNMSQIYDALSFYYENSDKINKEIEHESEEILKNF